MLQIFIININFCENYCFLGTKNNSFHQKIMIFGTKIMIFYKKINKKYVFWHKNPWFLDPKTRFFIKKICFLAQKPLVFGPKNTIFYQKMSKNTRKISIFGPKTLVFGPKNDNFSSFWPQNGHHFGVQKLIKIHGIWFLGQKSGSKTGWKTRKTRFFAIFPKA